MKISVIVCTRDRHETIAQALESIAECDYPSFDLHVMDQSTNTLTRQAVEALTEKYRDRCAIRYHHLTKAGLSRAYNAGMTASDGELLAFTDDDCIVPSDWLAQIAAAFAGDPEAGLIYGQVLIPTSLREDVAAGNIVPALPIPRRERLSRRDGFKVFGMGANMAIRRSLLEHVKGFDEALGGGGPLRSSQDFDFAYRTYRSGMAILLVPEVWVDHYGVRTRAQWPATLEAYGIGDGAFYGKHVRCGDTRAAWLLAKTLLRSWAREVRRTARARSWTRDIYGRNLMVGFRHGARFAIDREFRLYRETAAAKMIVTEANVVTSAKRG
ncbi:MAG: glycosyl transferase family 2 [Armatimonadetes bacterium]|jgi:GT2 family glycosyltransferase|nr:glycosyl transferase family 2 [Armatimonadota bacterium]